MCLSWLLRRLGVRTFDGFLVVCLMFVRWPDEQPDSSCGMSSIMEGMDTIALTDTKELRVSTRCQDMYTVIRTSFMIEAVTPIQQLSIYCITLPTRKSGGACFCFAGENRNIPNDAGRSPCASENAPSAPCYHYWYFEVGRSFQHNSVPCSSSVLTDLQMILQHSGP